MTFDDVRKFALLWAEVEDGISYGTPALKVRKKMLARLKEDGESGARSAKVEAGFASDRARIMMAHDLLAKPLTLWRIMR